MTAAAAGRDVQAERDHAEWAGWHEAQGYERDTGEADISAEAFLAGMQAARDLAAPALRLSLGPCGNHPGHAHAQILDRTDGNAEVWACLHTLAEAAEAKTCEPQPAPALAAAMAETRKVRGQFAAFLDMLHHNGSGYTLRLSGVRLAREYTAAGIPLPERLSHLKGQ